MCDQSEEPISRVPGVSIHSRFAFVQFEKEEDARAAVKAEHRTDFRAARLGKLCSWIVCWKDLPSKVLIIFQMSKCRLRGASVIANAIENGDEAVHR